MKLASAVALPIPTCWANASVWRCGWEPNWSFRPLYCPKANAYVERFHQDYQRHVWDDTCLTDPQAAQTQGEHFSDLYRHSAHHSALQGQTPAQCHALPTPLRLPEDFSRPAGKLPLYAGWVHFIRRIDPDDTISVLNVKWPIPNPDRQKGVWATLTIGHQAALLVIYDRLLMPPIASR